MTTITPCRLCGEMKELQESHILPGFVYRWMKETSATGYLRFAQQPNLRVQDGVKLRRGGLSRPKSRTWPRQAQESGECRFKPSKASSLARRSGYRPLGISGVRCYLDDAPLRQRDRYRPPVPEQLAPRLELFAHRVALVAAEGQYLCCRLSHIETDMPQAGALRSAPIHRDGAERRPVELDEVRVVAE
jgi:hypothetical protein